MNRETIQLFVDAATDAATVTTQLEKLLRSEKELPHWHLQHNLEGNWGAGAYTPELAWHSAAQRDNPALNLTQLSGFGRAHRVTYRSIGSGIRNAELTNGIWRTLLLRVRPVQLRSM